MNEKFTYLDVIIQWFKPVMISLLGSASGLIFGNTSIQKKLAIQYIVFAFITSAPSYYIALHCSKNHWIAGSICFTVSAFGFWIFRFAFELVRLPFPQKLDLVSKIITRKK